MGFSPDAASRQRDTTEPRTIASRSSRFRPQNFQNRPKIRKIGIIQYVVQNDFPLLRFGEISRACSLRVNRVFFIWRQFSLFGLISKNFFFLMCVFVFVCVCVCTRTHTRSLSHTHARTHPHTIRVRHGATGEYSAT